MKIIKQIKAWLQRRRAEKAMAKVGVHVTTDAVIRANAMMQMSPVERAAFRRPQRPMPPSTRLVREDGRMVRRPPYSPPPSAPTRSTDDSGFSTGVMFDALVHSMSDSRNSVTIPPMESGGGGDFGGGGASASWDSTPTYAASSYESSSSSSSSSSSYDSGSSSSSDSGSSSSGSD